MKLNRTEFAGQDAGRSPVVLYIGGDGRSGSTLLAAMLGRYSGFFPVGELRGIWQAASTDELCGCGTRFTACDFWRAVGATAFGGWDRINVDEMLSLDATYARHRSVARLIASQSLARGHTAQLARYGMVLRKVYSGVREVSGAQVIVDSTKDAPYGFILREGAGIDLRLVHLVRDSRGVAYSWSKSDVPRPEYVEHPTLERTPMNHQSVIRSALEWDLKNTLLYGLALRGAPRTLIRYESLIEDPPRVLADVLRLVKEYDTSALLDHCSDASRAYESLPHHTIGGNRIRFARGRVRLTIDDEWKAMMPSLERSVVTALTLPLLAAYGYVGRRASLR